MIYVTGDVHADSNDLAWRLHTINPQIDDNVIICGDVGIKYGDRVSQDLLWVMSNNYPDVDFIIMRGNHDDRYIRDMKPKSNNPNAVVFPKSNFQQTDDHLWYDINYPNVYYVSDTGGSYDIDGNEIIFIPGAFSVDREYRRAYQLPYEYQELLTEPEMSSLYDDIKRDLHVKTNKPLYIISHTCPLMWERYFRDLFFDGINQASVNKSMELWMNKVLDAVNASPRFKGWYFGHFHDDRDIPDSLGHMLFHKIIPIGSSVSENS